MVRPLMLLIGFLAISASLSVGLAQLPGFTDKARDWSGRGEANTCLFAPRCPILVETVRAARTDNRNQT